MNLYEYNNHSHVWAFLFFIAAGVLGYFEPNTTGIVGCSVLVLAGIFLLMDWFLYQRTRDTAYINGSDPNSAVRVMGFYATLSPEGQANLQAARVVVDYVLNFETRLERWHIPGMPKERGWYSTADVSAVWDLATSDKGMPPVGTWSEGSIRRECAVAMVQYFVDCGWLQRAAGNMSAQWVTDGYGKAETALWGLK